MNSTFASNTVTGPAGTPPAARTVLRLLRSLRHGSLTLQLPDGSMQRFGPGKTPHATLCLRNWNACGAALRSGDIGFAESYIAGDWTTPNLVELLRVLLSNRDAVQAAVYGSWAGRLLYRINHWRNRNNRTNSRKNIHAHYDLGNSFYRLWLDETRNYSSALFRGDRSLTLVQAQKAKVRRALEQARVRSGDRVLEIGCGWGALAEMAAQDFDAHVTGVTLSPAQLASARERMHRLGLGARTDLRLQDYRDIDEAPFDAICSIEMVEAVGQAYWPTYFATVARLLKPGGHACIQSIVIHDALFERYVGSTDFIQQYIFPGGCLPCPRAFRQQAQAAGLEVCEELAFGDDYAETLKRWRESFLEHRPQVQKNGFDARFMHIWEFYLAYCEAAFHERNVDVVQYTLRKPAR